MSEKKKIAVGLSGGVDSTVVAVLLHKAIGHRLHCIFVDNGVLRRNEGEEVVSYLREHFDLNLKYVQAADLFLERLEGVEDPEKKRKIIGHTFIEVFDREAQAIKAQGVKVDFWPRARCTRTSSNPSRTRDRAR